MERTLRNRRLPAVVLLLLCAAPPVADAQQFVCRPIVRGDTPSRLARQLTGKPAAVYSLAFQIRDPVRQMFVPKSQYRRGLDPHWQACVAQGPVKSLPLAYAPDVALAASAVAPVEPDITSTPLPVEPAPLASTSSAEPAITSLMLPDPAPPGGSQEHFVFVATISSAALLMLLIAAVVGGTLAARPIPPVMQRAGEEFVAAFARPLTDSSTGVPAIRARLRFIHRARQLEISIAPGVGRRYPNLVDHKSNVEYDVTRVMRILGPHFVVSDRLRAAGMWVVVRIRLADLKETGAK
jgi:hypothetical protein